MKRWGIFDPLSMLLGMLLSPVLYLTCMMAPDFGGNRRSAGYDYPPPIVETVIAANSTAAAMVTPVH